VTAAGFQLKGSGWYATDFKGSSNAPAPAAEGGKPADAKPADGAKPSESGKTSDSKPAESGTTASKPKPDAPAASAGSCGGACACH
jgi:hypothetical protein